MCVPNTRGFDFALFVRIRSRGRSSIQMLGGMKQIFEKHLCNIKFFLRELYNFVKFRIVKKNRGNTCPPWLFLHPPLSDLKTRKQCSGNANFPYEQGTNPLNVCLKQKLGISIRPLHNFQYEQSTSLAWSTKIHTDFRPWRKSHICLFK